MPRPRSENRSQSEIPWWPGSWSIDHCKRIYRGHVRSIVLTRREHRRVHLTSRHPHGHDPAPRRSRAGRRRAAFLGSFRRRRARHHRYFPQQFRGYFRCRDGDERAQGARHPAFAVEVAIAKLCRKRSRQSAQGRASSSRTAGCTAGANSSRPSRFTRSPRR